MGEDAGVDEESLGRRSRTPRPLLPVLIGVLLGGAAPAHAEPTIVGGPYFTSDGHQHIVLTVDGLPSPPSAELVLDGDGREGSAIRAQSINDASSGLMIVILVQGTRDVLGADGPAAEVRRAVDVLARPPARDVRVGLLSYGRGVTVVSPLYPRREVVGEMMGAPSGYIGTDTSALADAVDAAIAELSGPRGPRKVLVVVGNTGGPLDLADELAASGIATYVLAVGEARRPIVRGARDTAQARAPADIVPTAEALARRLARAHDVVFAVGGHLDGLRHRLAIKAGGETSAAIDADFPLAQGLCGRVANCSPWVFRFVVGALSLAGFIGIVVGVVGVVRWRARRAAPPAA